MNKGSQAQSQASLSRFNDPTGRCHYTFTVPSPTESSCSGSSNKQELTGVLSRLTLVEALVSRLVDGADGSSGAGTAEESLQEAYSQVTRERDQLQQDKEHLSQQVQTLQSSLAELDREMESLRKRSCQQTEASEGALYDYRPAKDPVHDLRNDAYQEMRAEVTELPASRLLPEGNLNFTGCGELLSVGNPVLHRKADSITGKYGVWLQDPDPRGPGFTNQTVWRIDAVGTDVRQLFMYEDMEQFSRGFPSKVLVLPEPVESTGATLYRGSLYYQRRRSRTLIRYDLVTESLASRLELPHAGFHGQHPYSWGGYTDIDLAVDERGLWAIYSTAKAKGAIVISQLDPVSLQVKESWETKIRKNSVANAFMGRATSVPFKNQYHYNSMVDYNHAHRKLYAWDNFHMVTYDVRLGRPRHRGN
ncbi:hypothetical protein OJAV_G00171320 [Oryzias javanicus]|uniref:Myocilin n=1 Tax=Oryzias javanicus TaxID=123683 RepID=A0A437CGP1_ORYJA|nr:hypothetical protein OJAV_G00171320 [Oryzias javanicus]